MTTVRRPSARHAMAAVALVAGSLLLAACADQTAGAAATYGDSRVSEQQLSSAVEEILVAKGQPADSVDQSLTATTLGRMLTVELVDILAAREAVVISQGAIDEQLAAYDGQAGGRDAVVTTFVEQGVAPSQIEDVVRLNLQAQALGVKLDPSGSAEEQGQAVFDAVVALSDELAVTASPRYGTWDATALTLGPVPDDLSAPPAIG